jgi:hypothetical protein
MVQSERVDSKAATLAEKVLLLKRVAYGCFSFHAGQGVAVVGKQLIMRDGCEDARMIEGVMTDESGWRSKVELVESWCVVEDNCSYSSTKRTVGLDVDCLTFQESCKLCCACSYSSR